MYFNSKIKKKQVSSLCKKNKNNLINQPIFISKHLDNQKKLLPFKKLNFDPNKRNILVKNKAAVLPMIALGTAAIQMVGNFFSEPSKNDDSIQNEVKFEVNFEDDQKIKNYVTNINSYINSTILNVSSQTQIKSANAIENVIQSREGNNNALKIINEQSLQNYDFTKITAAISKDITQNITKHIQTDIRTAFENKMVNDLVQKLNANDEKSAFGVLGKLLKNQESNSKIGNTYTNRQDIKKNVDLLFNNLSKHIESSMTSIKLDQEFSANSINSIINRIGASKGNYNVDVIKNTQGLNIILDKITELNITEKIFSSINSSENFRVKSETLNKLTNNVIQLSDVTRKEEKVSDVIQSVYWPWILGSAAVAVGGIFFMSSSKPTPNPIEHNYNAPNFYHMNDQMNTTIINLAVDLPDIFFYDQAEAENINLKNIVMERRRLLANKTPYLTKKLDGLFDYFFRQNINYSDPNNVKVSLNDIRSILKTARGVRFNENISVLDENQNFFNEKLSNQNLAVEMASGEFPKKTIVNEILFNL